MSQDSLMQRMLASGVDIHNAQAVYEFFHQGNGNDGTGEQLTTEKIEQLFNSWGATKANQSDIDRLQTEKAEKNEVITLQEQKADKAALEQLDLVKANRETVDLLQITKASKTEVNTALDQKLDRSEYHQHFKGVFLTIEALKSGVLDPVAGDYATVDAGEGFPTKIHVYDHDDGIWREQGSTDISALSTDNLPEGNLNLYFSQSRARGAVTGMSIDNFQEGADHLFFTEQRVLNVITPLLGNVDAVLTEILGE